MNNELFKILGVSTSASIEEIHAAFRKKARQHHPDLGGDRKKFQQINAAYEQLLKQIETEKSASIDKTTNPVDAQVPPDSPTANPYQAPPKQSSKKAKKKRKANAPSSEKAQRSAAELLTGNLPLQNQTTYFILVNALDIFITYLHLRSGNIEANPIAALFISKWNTVGMVAFKMTIVAAVCVIAQIVALKSLQKATLLLNFGTAIILCVVLYSIWLLTK